MSNKSKRMIINLRYNKKKDSNAYQWPISKKKASKLKQKQNDRSKMIALSKSSGNRNHHL